MSPDLFTLIPPADSPPADSPPADSLKNRLGTAIIANLPHSGLALPPDIAAQFTAQQRRTLPNSDWHLQSLYSFLPSLGVTVLQANYSRYVVDLNRALKPPLFGSFWSAVVPQQTAFKQPIYKPDCLPSKAQVRSRIDAYYTPYHRELSRLLNEAIAQFGKVYLLDLHSFMGLITDDVCLGNARGATCSEATLDLVAKSFTDSGYGVVKNKVFTGGHITQRYGHWPHVEALQIELRYTNYLPLLELEKPAFDQASPPRSTPDETISNGAIPRYESAVFTAAKSKLRTVFSQIVTQLAQQA